jgi:Phosphodiester glycosidase
VDLQRTVVFAQTQLVAITANTGAGSPATTCVHPDGLLVSNQTVVNAPQPNGPVLYFTSNRTVTIAKLCAVPAGVQNAIAGSISQDNDCLGDPQPPGGLLVENGQPGPCVIPKALTIAPRSAIGLDRSEKTLILVAIEGGEPASGLYTYDLALLMTGLGAYNAVNLDGGGSTTFYWLPTGGTPPPVSASLRNMMLGARFDHASPSALTFRVTQLDASTSVCYCAVGPTRECNPTKATQCRQVYANFGLIFWGTLAAWKR